MFLGKLQVAPAVLLVAVLLSGGAGRVLCRAGPQVLAERSRPVPRAEAVARSDLQGDPLPAGALARLGTVRFRHAGWSLLGPAFLPDGNTLVAAANQGHTIAFWDVRTGRLLREISTGTLSVRAFALAPDGKQAAVGGFLPDEGNRPTPGAVRVLDTTSGKEVRTFPRSDRDTDTGTLAFTPDGKLLVSLGDNGVLRLEEVASGVEILRQQFPRDIVPSLALAPDGATLAVASGPNSRKFYLWRWQTAEEPHALKVGDFVARWLAFSPDGKLLATASDRDAPIRVWDVASGRLLYRLEPPGPEAYWHSGLVFSPDGKTLIASSHRRTGTGVLLLWDPATRRYRGRLDASGQLAVSPDSRLVAAVGGNEVRVWDLASRKEPAANDEAHRGRVEGIAVAAGDLVATASDDYTVRLWDAATGKQRRKLRHGNWVRAVALAPDGSKVASSSLDDTVRLWDARTGREIYRLAGHGELGGRRAIGFTPDGKRLLSWGDDFYLRVWDVRTGKALREYILHPSGVQVPGEDAEESERQMFRMRLAIGVGLFSPNGKVFVLALGQVAHVFDVETGKEVRTVDTGLRNAHYLAISPDGKVLLAGGWGRTIQTKLADGRVRFAPAEEHPLDLWDLTTGKPVRQVDLPGSVSGPVAFSADGKFYATATDKPAGRIRLWETATGTERPSIAGFRGQVTALAFAPDGRYLVSAEDDTTALVWDLAAGAANKQ